MELTPGILALIGTIFGGVGLKVVEHFLTKSKARADDAKEIRDELRLTITSLREDNAKLETEVTTWRDRYYAETEKRVKAETELAIMKSQHP